jgi:hypothetical protein
MIVLGANSEVSREFVELILQKEEIRNVYLFSSNTEQTEIFKKHLTVKYNTYVEVIELDLMNRKEIDFSVFDYHLVFCASGYLGKEKENIIADDEDNDRILKN